MYFSARAEGRISYGHIGRTNSCFFYYLQKYVIFIDRMLPVGPTAVGRIWGEYAGRNVRPEKKVLKFCIFLVLKNKFYSA